MCFVSGTVVFTKSGMTPIEELAVGDSIWTSNSDTKKSELAAITVVSTQVSSRQLVIGSNCSEVHTTLNHPFLVNEEWLPASSIQIGDSLTSIDDKKIYINKISRVSEDRLVYNLTLSENHNFWVGSEKFLVHNGGCFSKGVSLDDGEEDVANNVIARHAEYGDATPQANNSMQLEVAGREDFEMYISSTTSNRTYWISMADGPKGAGLGCVNWVYIGENADVDFIGASNALFGADENVWQPLGMLYRDQAIAEGFPSEVTDEMRTSDMVGRTEDVLRNAKSRATEKGWIFQ